MTREYVQTISFCVPHPAGAVRATAHNDITSRMPVQPLGVAVSLRKAEMKGKLKGKNLDGVGRTEQGRGGCGRQMVKSERTVQGCSGDEAVIEVESNLFQGIERIK